jgi:hypothetical protein
MTNIQKLCKFPKFSFLPPSFDSQFEQFKSAKDKPVCKTKPYYTFTLTFSFLKTK